MRRRQLWWAAALAAGVAVEAGAVTYDWRSGEAVPGVAGLVRAMVTWDPDGAGPEPEWLVVGGEFDAAGDVVARNVAAWDGQRWQTLGEGLDRIVWALANHGGQLVAGGEFHASGTVACQYIARFDGERWGPLGSGLDDRVTAFGTFRGRLVAAGSFERVGGASSDFDQPQPSRGVALLEGEQWQPLGTGLPGTSWPNVTAVVEYDDRLIVAGALDYNEGPFDLIACWDGQSWQTMQDGLKDDHGRLQEVSGLLVYEG